MESNHVLGIFSPPHRPPLPELHKFDGRCDKSLTPGLPGFSSPKGVLFLVTLSCLDLIPSNRQAVGDLNPNLNSDSVVCYRITPHDLYFNHTINGIMYTFPNFTVGHLARFGASS